MLKMRLELLDGFEVMTAEDGERGCAMALSERPDIILMDLEMPGVDGWEATRRLKADPKTRDIPVIALSAHALAGSREKALAAGCDEFDTKPIEFDRLVATMRRGPARPEGFDKKNRPKCWTKPPPGGGGGRPGAPLWGGPWTR